MSTIVAAIQRLFWACFAGLFNGSNALSRCIASNGIVVFVGPNGSGKSLAAVDAVLPTLAGIEWTCEDLEHVHNRPLRDHLAGCGECAPVSDDEDPLRCARFARLAARTTMGVRYVYSTLPLLDDETGKSHELYRPLLDYRQLVEIEHADVLFDEVAGVSDAADSGSTPAPLRRWLQQLRKRDVRLRVTTPAWKRCSLPIRQVATLVVDCRSYFTERAVDGRMWRPRRAMLWEAYDAFAFSEFEKTTGNRMRREAQRYYWRPSGRAQHAYSTLAQVNALADVTDAGMCTSCGGTRSRPKCGCGPEVDAIPYGRLRVIEEVSKAGSRTRHAVAAEDGEDTAVVEVVAAGATRGTLSADQAAAVGQTR